MKKTMMAMMAALMMSATGTALAATPDVVDCRENAPCVEASYTCCGGGYYGGGRGRGGYGCGGGYCYGYENSEG
ncbi:MAG: hypothetical protein J6N99_10325 [Schwartzia sp.]|nr:hypothetical protein [Schwartzia sp. (in: firmicutes)]